MAVEIERKFLVHLASWSALNPGPGALIEQGYLSVDPERTVRVRLTPSGAWLTVKGATSGVSRAEFEYGVPHADAREMLGCCVSRLSKTRYRVPVGAHTWDVDVFHGPLSGLVLAEIELGSEEETFVRPAWLGEEVSADARYFNSALSAAAGAPV